MELRVKIFETFFYNKISTQNINVDMRRNIFLRLTTTKIKKVKNFNGSFILKEQALLVTTCSFFNEFRNYA